MDLARIEEQLCHVADVVLVEPRSLQQIIKLHRAASGTVPHGRCYAIARRELDSLALPVEVRSRLHSNRAWMFLVARSSPRELRRLSPDQLHERVLRAAFHASVHRALEGRALSPVELRARIERIGRTEFEEIRAMLSEDDLLLPPAGDLDVYVEFCAVFLELSCFAPELLETTFPGLEDLAAIERIVASDVDVAELLAPGGPPSVGSAARAHGVASRPPQSPPRPPALDSCASQSLIAAAHRAAQARDFARSTLLAARATGASEPALRGQARAALEAASRELSQQVCAALGSSLGVAAGPGCAAAEEWARRLAELALRAAVHGGRRASAEAKTLCCLQRAGAAHEDPGVIVDASSWLLSWGKRPIVRPRDALRELQVLQQLQRALEHAERARGAYRTEWIVLLQSAARTAEGNARRALRPKISGVLGQVGLAARSGPEQQARHQLVEELLDRILERGHLSLSQLRDAISRNEIKLPDLASGEELKRGDPLLLADARLGSVLDGIYRPGDVYLRILQKVSSLPFGTRAGRIVALYFAFPLVGSFVVLEGIRYLLAPVLLWLGLLPVDFLTWTSFLATATVLFCLLHSEECRGVAWQVLEVVGVVLAWVFFRIPRALLARPWVQRFLARPDVRGVIRCGVVPAGLGVLAYRWLPLPDWIESARAFAVLAIFGGLSGLLASPVGWWLETLLADRLAPTWHALSRSWIPQLLRLVGRIFRVSMDAVEQGVRWIDDGLRFRRSESRALLVLAGVAGAVWAVVGYVIRLYVTLLVEPEINPLKHFPVVTVAHKVLLPFTPDLLRAFNQAFSLLGDLVGGAVAGVTVFLLPSVFGFLVWELKENYRLYRATRSLYVPSARFGPHGETMQGLLVVGVHSGTLPRLYERLRRAAQRRDAASPGTRRARREAFAADAELRRFRKGIDAVERSLRHFVQRELVYPLTTSALWTRGGLSIGRIETSSNRIRIQLRCEPSSDQSASAGRACELTIELVGGRIIAEFSEAGLVGELDAHSAQVFENVLAVFYHRAQIDLVREQLEGELPAMTRYQVVEGGILLWSGDDYDGGVTYDLKPSRSRRLRPRRRPRHSPLPQELDARRILYSRQRIPWVQWEDAWRAAGGDGPVPRLLQGASLLPAATVQAAAIC